MSEFVNPNPGFMPESWALYSVGAVCGLLRLVASARRLGIKNLQLDDYFVAFGLVWYTILCVSLNEILNGAGSNLMTDEDLAALTPAIKASRVKGSKWVFVSEHAMLATIWSMKAAMLVLYARLTSGLPRVRKLLNYIIGWVVCGFIGDMVALLTICRPLSDYWAVPASNPQCSTYEYYQIVNAVFNISTDILILAIGLPPVLKARLSAQQKIILTFIFGLGSFVIVAAVLRAIYCLVPSLISMVYMNWYFREASVAVYVTNLPGIWTLLRELFPRLQNLGTRSESKNRSRQASDYTWGSSAHNDRRSRIQETKGFDFHLDTYPISKSGATSTETELEKGNTRGSSTDSHEHTLSPNEIRRDVTFTVERIGDSKI